VLGVSPKDIMFIFNSMKMSPLVPKLKVGRTDGHTHSTMTSRKKGRTKLMVDTEMWNILFAVVSACTQRTFSRNKMKQKKSAQL